MPKDASPCALFVKSRGVCMSKQTISRLKDVFKLMKLSDEDAVVRLEEILEAPDEISLLSHGKIRSIIGKDADREITQRFKPAGPLTEGVLLSNFDIDATLYHYALAYKGFMPISYSMIDFTNYESNLGQFSIKKMLDSGFTCAGCVINTDVHTGRGKHWICVFVDCRPSTWTVESFNSSGKPPRAEIVTWMSHVQEEMVVSQQISLASVSRIPSTEQKLIYGVQHQKGDSECGVYALYYIWSRIKGTEANAFLEHIIPDEKVAQFRQFIFRA